jgi:hypothetical protein
MTLTEEHKEFLIDLRDSGVTNMWGATPYIEARFNITRKEASDILLQWIKSFDE